MVLDMFLKIVLYLFPCLSSTPSYGPTKSPRIMIFQNLNLHFMRMLPAKFIIQCNQFFCSDGSIEDFQESRQFFNDF